MSSSGPRAPIEKMPLAVRKHIRDNWDPRKPELEEQLSKLLGVPWTIEVNPNLMLAYDPENTGLGYTLFSYFDDAIRRIGYFLNDEGHGDEGIEMINKACHKHIITLAPDLDKKVSYSGCDVEGGYLRLLFREDYFGVNINDAVAQLEKVLSAASDASSPDEICYEARASIKKYWEPSAAELQKEIGQILHNPDIKLTVDLKQIHDTMKASKETDDYWKGNIGLYARGYFEGVRDQLRHQKFEEDDMLYEGFADIVSKGEIVLRVVEKLKGDDRYNQMFVEDGKLVIQTTPKFYGTNMHSVAEKIIELL